MNIVNDSKLNKLCINNIHNYSFDVNNYLSDTFLQLRTFMNVYDDKLKVININNIIDKYPLQCNEFIYLYNYFKKIKNTIYIFDNNTQVKKFAELTHNYHVLLYSIPYVMIINGSVVLLDFRLMAKNSINRVLEHYLYDKICGICMDQYRRGYLCPKCYNTVCVECTFKYDKNECPFCRTSF